jgi:hypothetical protein
MGQKSNINSIRPFLNQPNFSNYNLKMNFLEIVFSKNLKFLLKIKGIHVSKITLGFTNNRIYVCFNIFFSTQKVIKYRKFKDALSCPSNVNLNKLFKKLSNLLKSNLIDFKVININKQIDNTLASQVFLIYKKYLNSLFDKKFYLCLDITKVTVLFLLNKIETKGFLEYTGKSFCSIHKKNHVRYFKLISNIFNFVVFKNTKQNTILGIKLQISGKLKGKAMASQQLIVCGSMPTQTINKNICFEKMHVYTTYGVFGFKLWVHRKQ